MFALPNLESAPASSRPVFRVLCAWCEQPIAQAKPATDLSRTSHGICAPCARRHFGLDLEVLTENAGAACAA